ncbi:MAG: ribosome assembly cofactor RimP [Bacteroidetes bacterium]|nr:ribosome assembly cofactor RimP [Bacteroidota bacterium]
MLDKKIIKSLAEERINELNNGLYIVELSVSSKNVIQVEIDKLKGGVSVEDCISVSRNIEHNLDRDKEDFELHVSSAGLDKPLRHVNQYAKNVGRVLSVLGIDGKMQEGELVKVIEDRVVLRAMTKKLDEKKKKKIRMEEILEYPFSQIKEAKIVISFK